MMYEHGPCKVEAEGGTLRLLNNPGAWNSVADMLFIDQPYGTGFSVAEHPELIPADTEVGAAHHLYLALWNFFDQNPDLAERPLIIAGESYGGKFVPSITHFILQLEAQDARGPRQPVLRHRRDIGDRDAPAPNFSLRGMMVGNGLTDPVIQETMHAQIASDFGIINDGLKAELQLKEAQLVGLIGAGQWAEAHALRTAILSEITEKAGLGTLLDVRRLQHYDEDDNVQRFLNRTNIKAALGAKAAVDYRSCSPQVRAAMSRDVMRSVAHLVPDILDSVPCLFFQGQFDGQDGAASNEKWILAMQWPGIQLFREQPSRLWHADGAVAGYWQKAGNLQRVVVRNAGHMVPHDQPTAAKAMLRDWLEDILTEAQPA